MDKNLRNMSILQGNNVTERIPGMKECQMTQEKTKENCEFTQAQLKSCLFV